MNIPDFLIDLLRAQYGKETTEKILEGYSINRKVTFRVNTLKTSIEKIENRLKEEKIKYEKVPWSEEAFILNNVKEIDIQKLDIYENGEIYLQSLSSMLPPIILQPKENADILDMTAAPGGKTTQMAAISNNKSHITACEMNNIRIEKLKYNIEKQGASCVYIMQKDSRQIDDFFSFDQILLDAPCSGSGTLNLEDSNISKYFTTKLIEKTTKSQITLLKKALKILKLNSQMVYSTCSILEKENEEIVRNAISGLNAEIVPINFEGIENLPLLPTKLKGTLCVCPNELYEGFFIAKIKKIK